MNCTNLFGTNLVFNIYINKFYSILFLCVSFVIVLSCGSDEELPPEKEDIKITSIEFSSPPSETLKKHDTVQLSLKIAPSNATDKGVTWRSSDETIATVSSNGLVNAVGVGDVTISVTSNKIPSISNSIYFKVTGETTNDILSFSYDGKEGTVIGDNKFGLQVAEGTNLTNLLPVINHNGESISPSIDTPQDFTEAVTYTVTAETGDTQEWTIKIIAIQEVPNSPGFITTWVTTNLGESDNFSIEIPTYPVDIYDYNYNYNVDWGDGHVEENLSGNPKHSYEIPGTYCVSITGDFPRLFFNSNSYEETTDRQKIILINQWGNIQWKDLSRAFKGCTELDVIASDTPDMSNVFRTEEMFRDCKKMVGNSSFENWNVSNISSMSFMFSNCDLFNENIGSWNISNTIRVIGLFQNATAFNQDIGNWDLTNVEYMRAMFGGATSFNQDIGNWYFPKVVDLSTLFQGAKAFNQDISTWDVSGVEDFSAIFNGAENFNQPIGVWDMSSAIDLAAMFQGAHAFTQDITSWNLSSVKTMANMFAYNVNFNQDIGSWDTSNVEVMGGLFWNNTAFNQDISLWDVSKITDMQKMFKGATAFDQNLGDWDVSNVSNMLEIFEDTKLSKENYDGTLNGWNALSSLQNDVEFEAGSSTYCGAETARQNLIDTYGWSISDGGKDCD